MKLVEPLDALIAIFADAALAGPFSGEVNASEDGEALIVVVVRGVTVSVTGTVSGLFEAPAAVMVTDPAKVPASMPLPFTDTVRVAGVVPLEVTISRPPDCLEAAAVMFNAPPVLVINKVWAAGDDPPAVSLKESEDGDALIVMAAAGLMVTLAVVFAPE